ncbi:hypothetical protein ACHAXM_003784 [Skeletonema potamos]
MSGRYGMRGSIVADADYHELPEVLRFNKYGGVLSHAERERVAKSKGLCNKCGKVTHKVTAFRSIPLDNDDVKKGLCLTCHPEQRVENDRKNNGSLGAVIDAGTKAAKFFGETAASPPIMAATKRGMGRRHRPRLDTKNDSLRSITSDDSNDRHNFLRKNMFSRRLTDTASNTSPSPQANHNNTSTAFSHGGVVPLVGSILMDPLRQQNNVLQKMGAQRHLVRQSISQLDHDFSAPQNNEDAWDIVKEMRSKPHDIDLLIRKCHELRSIGTNSAGALYEIIEVMRRHPKDRNLQFAAIGALWSVSADGDDDSKSEAIDAGAAIVIIDAVNSFPADVNLVCWGIGALSSFAEGITGRGSLINSGAIDTLETVLEKHYKAESKVACAISYWVFRCLLLLVVSYDLSDSFMSSWMKIDVRKDSDEKELFIKTLSKHNIIHLVVSAMASGSMDAITLSTAFMFLSHISHESYIHDEWESLSKVVPPVIQEKSYASFPVMKMLSFAILCELLKYDPSFPSSSSVTSDAVREALGKLLTRTSLNDVSRRRTSLVAQRRSSRSIEHENTNKRVSENPPENVVQDIMICILSHALTYSDTTLGFSDSKNALKSAISILGFEEANMFAKTSSCWIIFGVFRRSDTIKNTSFAKQAAGAIQSAMTMHQSSPHLLTIGFAALSAAGIGITDVKPLVDMILSLKSAFPNEKSLLKEACRFLSNFCQTKQDVEYVLSAGGLELATTLLKDEEKSQGREAVHLVYKFVLFAGAKAITLDNFYDILEVRELAKDNVLLAAEMIYVLTKSVSAESDIFEKTIKDRSPSVRQLKRNDDQGIIFPVAQIFIFFEFIVEVAEKFESNRNFMKCACLAIKIIALTAQRAKMFLQVERPISVVEAALTKLKGLQAPIDAIWALLGVDHPKLGPSIIRDVSLSMINCIEGNMGTNGHQFLESNVSASFAVLSTILSESKIVQTKKDLLELETVERVIELVLMIFYSCLDKHGNFPTIFKYGFQLLLNLSDDSRYRSIIVKHGGIVAVADAMMTNAEDMTIQTRGCIIIRSLSETDNATKINVVEADGVDVLLNIMTTPDTDLNAIKEAMRAIWSLSLGQESRLVVEQEGGIAAISNVLSAFMDNAPIQEIGLATLCFLASDADGRLLEASSLFTTVRNSLSRHQGDVSIHQNGFALLEMLSLRCNAVKNKIVSSGCIDCVIETVVTKKYPSKVVGNAFEIVINLIDSEECREMISKPEILESIIFSMMFHVECYKVQLNGCHIIVEMCQKINSGCIVKAGGVKASLCAMMVHSMSEDIQSVACSLLSRLSSEPSCLGGGSQGTDLGPKIVEAIISAMDNFPGSQQVQTNGILALENMVIERREMQDHARSQSSRIWNALRSATGLFPKECSDRATTIEKYLKPHYGQRNSC